MSRDFLSAVEHRRSLYALNANIPLTDGEVEDIIRRAVRHAPSPFNSQSSRVVLMKGEEHQKLWGITLEALKKATGSLSEQTSAKIASFAAAYATILYFEEEETTKALQEKFPLYAEHFPKWAENHEGLLQFIIWTALEDAGLGANLQHYNPLIDEAVRKEWALPASWRLIAQMPFGGVSAPAGEKEFMPIEERFKTFG